jgi:hypothetical protein
VAGDVADGEGERPVEQQEGVVPVPAHLGALGRRPVADGHLEVRHRGRRREQGGLQRLGASAPARGGTALGLPRANPVDRLRERVGDELEEAEVGVVGWEVLAEGDDQHRLARGVERGQRQPGDAAAGAVLDHHLAPVEGRRGRGRQPVVARGPGRTGEADVDRGQVLGGGPQERQRPGGHLIGVVDVSQPAAEAPEQVEPAGGEDRAGGLHRDVQDALDPSALAADGGVGEREEGLVEAPAPQQRHRAVLQPGGAAAGAHPDHQRADRVPSLGEHVPRRGAERRGVLVGDQLDVGRVVDEDELRPPEEGDREARAEREGDRAAHRRGPAVHRPERRGAPVDGLVRGPERAGRGEERVVRHPGSVER